MSLSKLIDAHSRHAVLIQRYSAGLEKEAAERLERAIAMVLGSVDNIGQLSLILDEQFEDFIDDLSRNIDEFSEAEVEYYASSLESTVRANIERPPVDSFRMSKFLFDPSLSINTALQAFSESKRAQAIQAVRDAFSSGETEVQAVQRLRNIIPLIKSQAASLVRTVTNKASTEANYAVLAANSDILRGYRWVSTLDMRTSSICMARDGQEYRFSPESPLPPAHWSCRSVIVPLVKKEFDIFGDGLGDRPAVNEDGAERVSARVTYGGWLRRQSVAFQNEVLGEERARLFRSGRFTLDRFVDDSGRRYTLQELRSLYPLAYDAVN